jgi:DNA (cytosine-5)-methyltransferase 1
MNELALFAGAGGVLPGQLLGWTPVCAVELDPYCRSVLLQRQRDGLLPTFPIWDDIKTFDGKPWKGTIDVVSGGWPCTDISTSKGKGKGLAGPSSGLWFEMLRIIGEVQPTFVFAENSSSLRSRGLGTVIKGLTKLGYDVRWGMLGAWHVGSTPAPHKRNRAWIYATNATSDGCISKRELKHAVSTTPHSEWGTTEPFDGSIAKVWETEPDVGRVVDGVAYTLGRRDRIRALGKGQVPTVAATAWTILHESGLKD